MNNPDELTAVGALEKSLAEVPFLTIHSIGLPVVLKQRNLKPDIVMEAVSDSSRVVLFGEWKNSGQPRIARNAVYKIEWIRTALRPSESYGVFMAPYIAPEAAEICREHDIGYLDLAGNCRLSFANVFIQREGRPNPSVERRNLRTLYSPKAERLLRVLLSEPDRTWKTRPLAEEADVSLGQVSKVRRLLLEREWVTERPDGIRLSVPGVLLADWMEHYNPRRSEAIDCYGEGDVSNLEYRLADLCRKRGDTYAMTQFSSAARIAPHVIYRRMALYFSGSIMELLQAADLKEVSSGANVTILNPYDEGVYYGSTDVQGVRVVSPIQTILDLRDVKGRGEEAARHILETRLGPSW